MTIREWRGVPGYSDYDVSNHGDVRTYKRPPGYGGGMVSGPKPYKILKPQKKYGYPTVCLFKNGKRKYIGVHRLVAMAFIGPYPSKDHVVCHNDGSRDNNFVGNLRYDTQSGNLLDRTEHGRKTSPVGSEHPFSKLTDDIVIEARKRYKTGDYSVVDLANQYGVHRVTMGKAIRGETWSHVE